MANDVRALFTFWGKLKSNKTLVTSEGTLRYVVHDDSVPYNNYGFFLVEKRKKNYLILKYLNETIMKQLVPSSR
jgi:hypothetical protein